jgi:hypothetical protein
MVSPAGSWANHECPTKDYPRGNRDLCYLSLTRPSEMVRSAMWSRTTRGNETTRLIMWVRVAIVTPLKSLPRLSAVSLPLSHQPQQTKPERPVMQVLTHFATGATIITQARANHVKRQPPGPYRKEL